MSTIRQKLGRLSTDLTVRGEVALQRPELIKGAECLVRMALALLLSRAEMFGGYTPFGVSIVAVSGAGVTGFLAFLGALAGCLMGGNLVWGLKYASMAVLVYAASFVFHDLKSYQKNWFMPAVAAFMAACTGFVYAQDAGWTVEATVFFLTETVLVGGGAYFFRIALSGWTEAPADEAVELQRTISVLILLGACLIALERLTFIAGISVGRLVALFVVMSTAYRSGVGAGSAAGAALGLAMDAGLGGAPFFSMAYAFSGLLSGLFGRHGKLMFTVSFILANTVCVLWTWDTALHLEALYEVFVVSMLFMVTPAGVLSKVSVTISQPASYSGGVRVREYARNRVEQLSRAFHHLYETVCTPTVTAGNDNDIATVFDRAADACCRKCVRSTTCWHKDYETTVDAMNNASTHMLARGKLKLEDFPTHFTESCKHLEDYIDAVNEELRALMYRRQFNSRLRDAQATMYGQYEDMSAILGSVATELATDLTYEPFAEKKLRRYLRGMDVEADTAVFRDRNGRLHAEIRSANLKPLLRDKAYLAKLSAVLGTRLCERREETADGYRVEVLEAEPLAAAVGIASVRKKGQVVSGDKGTYFKTDDGTLYVILSDGMGTGDGAARESGEAITILEQFLKAGLAPKSAMKLMNSAMQVRNGQVTTSATVDLMGINLFSGQAQLLKYGAAPTYVKRGKSVKAIQGDSLPAGIRPTRNCWPDAVDMTLQPGHFAVIASDGISGEEDDRWIRQLIAGYTGLDAKELARLIMEAAIDRFGCEDDMTVLTIFLEERA